MTDDIPDIHSIAQLSGAGGWRLTLPHSSPDGRLFWLTQGQGHILLDGLRHSVAPNSAVFVPGDRLLAFEAAQPLFGTAVSIPQGTEVPLPENACVLRLRTAQSQSELSSLLDAMSREQRTSREYHGQAARAHAMLISVWLRRIVDDTPAPDPLRADQRLTRNFARLIARDYSTGAPMARYADMLDVSPAHLSRSCKRACGKSAAALLSGRILHGARSLLSDSPHRVGRIASHLGFTSASQFTRFIQNQTGMTPTQLRIRTAHPSARPE